MKKSLPLVTKTMLPEVLPDPRRPAAGASAPRHRTMAHMQRLLATAAAVGVASAGVGAVAATGAAAAGCGKSTKVPDGKSDGSAAVDNNGNTSGYAVVDPMPPPAHCPGVAKAVAASAKFVAGDAGSAVLVVRFPNPKGRDDYTYLKDAVSVAYGGAVLKTEVKPDAVTVTVKPDATSTTSAATVTVTVKGHCDAGPSSIMARVSWTGLAKEGTAAILNLDDMYDY